jgi:ribosomal protein S18 acetylase RimI-like enzyme
MKVILDVPDHLPYQLVYRSERTAPFEVTDGSERFLFLHTGTDGLRHFGELSQRFGKVGALKTVMKLFTRSRSFYFVTDGGRVVSDGWCTLGRCGYYKIEPNAVVIGPIWTSDECRGRGLATRALMLAMNDLYRRGTKVFYIDTAKTNTPAQKVFAKCGFGPPMALYIRDEGVAR